MSNLKDRVDKMFDYIAGEKVKGKLESLIASYNQSKDNPASLLDLKDEFNALSFSLGEILAKAKEIQSLCELEVQNGFNDLYESVRGEVNSATGRNYSGDDAKYKARQLNTPNYLTHIYAERGYGYVLNYHLTCKSYRDNCTQRIAILREELFSSRQQV